MNTIAKDVQVNKPLIMAVDDNIEFLSGIELTLEMEGFEVWTATNAQQALKELEAAFKEENNPLEKDAKPNRLPDLILADIMMPVMDGYSFYEKVSNNPFLTHIPFIFLTAKSSDVDVRVGKELGINDYLSKLVSSEDLLASIRGNLKRIETLDKSRKIFTGDIEKPLVAGNVFLIVSIIILILVAFCAGIGVGSFLIG